MRLVQQILLGDRGDVAGIDPGQARPSTRNGSSPAATDVRKKRGSVRSA
jgi:hypothetical protein